MAANANLHKERIDTLLAIRVYHLDPSNARDMDNTCTAEVMQCLVRYALRPSFSNPIFAVAIKLAREKIAQLEFSVNKHLDIVTKHNVDFDVDRAAKPFTTESFKTLSTGFKKRPKQRINLRFLRRSVKGTKEKGKKLIGSLPSDSSPISEEEEQETASILVKRKRTSPTSRAKSSSAPQISSAPTTVATLPSTVLVSGLAPSPDEDDHVTIKRLKIQHSQGSGLHVPTSLTPIQPPIPVQPAIPA